MFSLSKFPGWLSFAVAVGFPALVGCGDEDETDSLAGSARGSEPLYAMMVQVYDADDRTVYVHLSKSLELDAEIDLARAREFPGVANFAPVGGRLLISSGIEPEITEFEISDSLRWEEGRSVNFMTFPLEDNANFYYQYILNDNTAYMPFDVTKRVIWDPTAMRITGTREGSEVPLIQGGLRAQIGGNRNAVRYRGPVQQAFFYTDEDWFETGPESVVAIYDEDTHEETERVTLPCPGLSIATQDEAGYTYYGTWGFLGTQALYDTGVQPCIARLTPERALDAEWTTDLREQTGGRYHNNFRYIGNGKAIANVFHHEVFADVDWTTEYDADVAERVERSGDHWRLWLFDLENDTAREVEGIDEALGSGAQFAVHDGRTFVFLPYDDWGRTKIYEIDAAGQARRHADTLGDVFKWVKVR